MQIVPLLKARLYSIINNELRGMDIQSHQNKRVFLKPDEGCVCFEARNVVNGELSVGVFPLSNFVCWEFTQMPMPAAPATTTDTAIPAEVTNAVN